MKLLKREWLQLVILAAPFCAVALLWDKLPEWVPIHWNARGQVDDYAGKAFGTLLLPSINVGMALLLGLLPLIDPKLRKLDAGMRASLWRTVKVIRLTLTAVFSVLALALLAAALGVFRDPSDFVYFAYGGVAIIFVVLGNFMTRLRPNYFLGIRTPWTLESKEVWMRTHRVGGRVMMLGGLAMLAFCFIVPMDRYAYWVLLPFVAAMSLFSIAYSYILYRKQQSIQPLRP